MYSLDDRPFFDLNQVPKQQVSNTIQGMGTSNEQAAAPLGPSGTEQQLNGMLLGKGVEAGGNAIVSGVQGALAPSAAAQAAAASGLPALAGGAAPAIAGSAGAGAGAMAGGTAAMAALGPVGAGLIGAKMLGLFNNGTTSVPGYYSGTPSVAGGGKGVGTAAETQPSGGIAPTPNANPMASNVMGNIGQLLTDPSNPGGNNASPMAGGSAPAQGGK